MPTLSKHYAIVTLPNGTELKPISVNITADEAWAPYVQGTVVLPSNQVTGIIDPRAGDRLKIRMQQDFGDIVYLYELTAAFGGDVSNVTAAYSPNITPEEITRQFTYAWNIFEQALPISTITTAFSPVTPLKLTNANLSTVWRMTEYLQDEGTFNPPPSTMFTADLGVRSIAYDYVSKEATIEVASDEALAQDRIGYGSDIAFFFSDLRTMINFVFGSFAQLEPGPANFYYEPPYSVPKFSENLDNTLWDFLDTVTKAANLVIYCDEKRRWHLIEPTATAGTLNLKDDDNITAFTKQLTRDGNYYNNAIIRYNTPDGVFYDDFSAAGGTPRKSFYQVIEGIDFPGYGAAQAIVQRSLTRGELYDMQAVANFDGRPRQSLTVDITGEPVKTGIVQSVSWTLPGATMNLELRDLEEV